jgi:hypothetical protein
MLSIGIRYCGGCNPQIDRSGIITSLHKALKKRGMAIDYTTDRQRSVDLVLLINGCMHACIEEAYLKEGHTTPRISVKGERVDDSFVAEECIPDLLSKKISALSPSFSK